MKLRKSIIEKMLKMDSIMRKIDGRNSNNDRRLSLLELRTLLFIDERNGAKPMDLAKEFKVTPATITAQIDRLVKKNCLIRETDKEDGRSVNLILTEKAKKGLVETIEKRLKTYDAIFKNLTDKELATLLELMGKMESGLE